MDVLSFSQFLAIGILFYVRPDFDHIDLSSILIFFLPDSHTEKFSTKKISAKKFEIFTFSPRQCGCSVWPSESRNFRFWGFFGGGDASSSSGGEWKSSFINGIFGKGSTFGGSKTFGCLISLVTKASKAESSSGESPPNTSAGSIFFFFSTGLKCDDIWSGEPCLCLFQIQIY